MDTTVILVFGCAFIVFNVGIEVSATDNCNLVESGFSAKTVDIGAACETGRIDWHYTTPYIKLHFEKIGQYVVCIHYSDDYSVQQEVTIGQTTQNINLRHRASVSRICALTNVGDMTLVIQPRNLLYMTTISYSVYTEFS